MRTVSSTSTSIFTSLRVAVPMPSFHHLSSSSFTISSPLSFSLNALRLPKSSSSYQRRPCSPAHGNSSGVRSGFGQLLEPKVSLLPRSTLAGAGGVAFENAFMSFGPLRCRRDFSTAAAPANPTLFTNWNDVSDPTAQSDSAAPTSAYVHIPFCRRRCFYCDFTILAIGETTDRTRDHQASTMMSYVDLVCKEIATTARKSVKGGAPLQTLFFGGGTPSLLPVPLLQRIIDEVKARFEVSVDAEISMEMDPGTFDREKLAGLLESGITRVSLGVQSFEDELLKACGRSHSLQDVYDAVEVIQSVGLENWSLDLMASLPNQTMEQWEHSLQVAMSLRPAHISVYDLQIEEGTLFNRWYKAGQEPLPSDDKSAELYRRASLKLSEAGYEHYEVSNYAKPGFQCRHNLVYWENRQYYAFGLGSTSYVAARRLSRPKKMKEYKIFVDDLDASSDSLPEETPQESVEEKVLDTIMLSLRLARGLNLTEFEGAFGSSITSTVCSGLARFVESGLVQVLDAERRVVPRDVFAQICKDRAQILSIQNSESLEEQSKVFLNESVAEACRTRFSDGYGNMPAFVRLTDPEGFLLSNEVISSIFSSLPGGGG